MSKTNLVVKISKKTSNGVESWEGTAALPGVAPTKLVKAKTNESKFSTRSALTSAAQRLAERYGFSEVKFEGATENKKDATPAAAKSQKRTSTRKTQAETEVTSQS